MAATGSEHLPGLFTHPQTVISRVGFLLPNLDGTSADAQEQVAETLLATEKQLWLASVNNLRKLIPKPKLALVVYLGLDLNGRMQVLIQPKQRLRIDKGSLKKGPRPAMNSPRHLFKP